MLRGRQPNASPVPPDPAAEERPESRGTSRRGVLAATAALASAGALGRLATGTSPRPANPRPDDPTRVKSGWIAMNRPR